MSVSSITYVQESTTKTLSRQRLRRHERWGSTWPADAEAGKCWPATDEVPDAVRIAFVAGFGTSPESVPQSLRNGVMAVATQLFESRARCRRLIDHRNTRSHLRGFRRLGGGVILPPPAADSPPASPTSTMSVSSWCDPPR